MIERISHFGVCVSDLPRSVAFYRDALGFTEEGGIELIDTCGNTLGLESFELHTCYVSLGEVRIELLHFPRSNEPLVAKDLRRMNHTGLTHIALAVNDIDQVAERVLAHGGKVFPDTRSSLDSPQGTISLMYCSDPDFTRVELIKYPI